MTEEFSIGISIGHKPSEILRQLKGVPHKYLVPLIISFILLLRELVATATAKCISVLKPAPGPVLHDVSTGLDVLDK